MKDFHDLFQHELKEIYSAETQIERALPEFSRAAFNPELKKLLMTHAEETKRHTSRLKKIGSEMNISLEGGVCSTVRDMIQEGKQLINQKYPPHVQDAALIGVMQQLEHYQMAVYGVLKAYARHLGHHDIMDILQQTSKEEGRADKALTSVAEGMAGINAKAAQKRKAA